MQGMVALCSLYIEITIFLANQTFAEGKYGNLW